MQALKDWLAYLALRVFVCLVQTLSLETCERWTRLIAWLASDVVRLRDKVVEENLRLAYPRLNDRQRRKLKRRMWRHLLLMVCEIAHAPRKIHDTNWRNYFSIPGQRALVRVMLDGRPVVLVSGHFGNFEIASYITGLLGFPTYAIARTLDNRFVDAYIRRFREANGQFILPKEGSAKLADRVLKSGGIIALLGDQSAGSKGCWVDFMGRPASSHKAVALFALSGGAPLVVSFALRNGGPLHFELGLGGIADPAAPGPEMASVHSLTQWYNSVLESAVRLAPEQYWWVHRRWKGTPPQRKSRAKAA